MTHLPLTEFRLSSVDAANYAVDFGSDPDLHAFAATGTPRKVPRLAARRIARWAGTWPLTRQVYLVSGLGDGSPTRALLARIRPQAHIVVMEPDPNVIATVVRDDTSLLQDPQVRLVWSDDSYHVRQRLGPICDMLCRRMIICSPIEPSPDHMEQFGKISAAIIDLAESRRTSLITQISNSHVTGMNLLDNFLDYLACPGIEMLSGHFAGQPAVCVAAGPSLDKHMETLYQTQGQYVMISCLTLLKPLLQHDIWPNFITALDYSSVSGCFLEGVPACLRRIHAVYEPKTSADVVRMTLEREGNVSLLDHAWLDDMAQGAMDISKAGMDGGCTVAHLSFHLAHYLGCDPIILVGHDLAFSPDEEGRLRYYPECVYEAHPWKEEQRRLADPRRSPVLATQDKEGHTIGTNDQMRSYLQDFETIWATCPAQVIDCTEGGAVKSHVNETMPLSEALEKHTRIDGERIDTRYLSELAPWKIVQPGATQGVLAARYDTIVQIRDMVTGDIKRISDLVANNWADHLYVAVKSQLTKNKAAMCQSPLAEAIGWLEIFSGAGPLARIIGDYDIALDQPIDLKRRDRQVRLDLDCLEHLRRAAVEVLPPLRRIIDALARPHLSGPLVEYGGHGPWRDT